MKSHLQGESKDDFGLSALFKSYVLCGDLWAGRQAKSENNKEFSELCPRTGSCSEVQRDASYFQLSNNLISPLWVMIEHCISKISKYPLQWVLKPSQWFWENRLPTVWQQTDQPRIFWGICFLIFWRIDWACQNFLKLNYGVSNNFAASLCFKLE